MRRFLLLTVCLYWPVIYGKAVFASEIHRGVMLNNSCTAYRLQEAHYARCWYESITMDSFR